MVSQGRWKISQSWWLLRDLDDVFPSSSGGILVEEGQVEECNSDEEVEVFEDDRASIERDTINRVAKAVFDINKNDREELIRIRKKMMEVQKFIERKGFSMAKIKKESITAETVSNAGFNNLQQFVTGRDEYGLPIFKYNTLGKVLDKLPNSNGASVSGMKDLDGKDNERGNENQGGGGTSSESTKVDENLGQKTTSWSRVVKNALTMANSVKFDYIPLPEGTKVVSPPDAVLQKGIEKFKNCVVGKISKGSMTFGRVSVFARRAWGKKGLISVSQKDTNIFIFKFVLDYCMNNVLSQGTWYIDSTPMLVHPWGFNILSDKVKTIPLWVRFEKIPDCYWTQEGLSNLAIVMGRQLFADEMTSKLDILPFARFCVEYKVGNDLPSKIEATDMDPVTGEKSIVEANVFYPNKPRICSACQAIGHIVGACPLAKRHWVPKVHSNLMEEEKVDHVKEDASEHGGAAEVSTPEPIIPLAEVEPGTDNNVTPGHNHRKEHEEGWQTVKHKRSFSPSSVSFSDGSPTPLNTFKNLAQVDEIDAKRVQFAGLSKSQIKKRKKALGKPSNLSP
ncbi:hypothetical protein POM88_045473 [Heracleum sosnowskyi]|uniref:DUF4283 domain-containing protein n=1 Tax=Heracleum sosnowskyi TaxID=360622 RepID=A0AAD8H5R8_9APIA|nr:hypothetical protein POM88_045473 [Heracleum sosnowskyi]